ncbi:MAG: hypothetical protein ACOYMN_01140 [Roseimicrobium sp.]
MSTLCHDFKSPRNDTSKRLPPVFMVVPILFYTVLIGGTYMGVTSYMSYRQALQNRDQWKQQQTEHDEARKRFDTERTTVEREKTKAETLAQWVEGTRALQPISVAVIRSMPPEISLADLSLERSRELPQQILMNVRINSGTLEEIGRIQNAISSLNYKAYNSQQLKAGDSLEYRSMLVWQQM